MGREQVEHPVLGRGQRLAERQRLGGLLELGHHRVEAPEQQGGAGLVDPSHHGSVDHVPGRVGVADQQEGLGQADGGGELQAGGEATEVPDLAQQGPRPVGMEP